jgi:hypothetical protein
LEVVGVVGLWLEGLELRGLHVMVSLMELGELDILLTGVMPGPAALTQGVLLQHRLFWVESLFLLVVLGVTWEPLEVQPHALVMFQS